MLLSWWCYGVVIALMLWGVKFAGFGKKFNEDFTSLNVTRSLRGISALCILLHHISLQDSFRNTGELNFFFHNGFFFVSIFFFYSGYGLLKSIDTKPGYLNDFLKTRVIKSLLIPFYLNIFLTAIFLIVTKHSISPLKWITGLTGLTLLNEYAWYPVVLVLLYLLFYILFYHLRKREDAFYFVFLAIIVLALVFCIYGHYPFVEKNPGWNIKQAAIEDYWWWNTSKQYWFCGEWWVNTNIAFLMGMIFANREKEIVEWFKSFYWIKLVSAILIFFGWIIFSCYVFLNHNYWIELYNGSAGVFDRFLCFFVQQPLVILFMLIVLAVMMKFESINPVTQFLGKHSLEIYLMSYITIKSFSFLIYKNETQPVVLSDHSNMILFTVCVLVTTILCSVLFKMLCRITGKLFDKKEN